MATASGITPKKVNRKEKLNFISSCLVQDVSILSMDQLNSLVSTGLWKKHPSLWAAIYNRFTQLMSQPDFPFSRNHLGTREFWVWNKRKCWDLTLTPLYDYVDKKYMYGKEEEKSEPESQSSR
jgi:hypothetical protein